MLIPYLDVSVLLVLSCWAGAAQAVIRDDTTLVVGSILAEPFLIKHTGWVEEEKKNMSYYDGFMKDLMDELCDYLKISYVFRVREDGDIGYQFPNGSWGGLIGDIITNDPNKKIDIAAAPVTETSSRIRFVDFTTPFMNFGSVAIMKKPHSVVMTLKKRFQRLFSPLSEGVWMTTGLAWLVTSAALYTICHISPYEWRRLHKDHQATMREGESFTCPNAFWFTLATSLLQGFVRAPRSFGARIVVVFWWWYMFIFLVVYIASMTNYLRIGPTETLVDYNSHIESIEDLANQQDIKYGVVKNSASQHFLMTSPIHRLRRMGEQIRRESSYVSSYEEGIRRVRHSDKPFAFIAESAMANYYAKQRPCDIYMLGDFSVTGSYSLAMPIQFSMKDSLNVGLLHLKEIGVLKKLHNRWFEGVCTDFLKDSSRSGQIQIPPFYKVDLGTFSGALILLGVGLGAGSLVTLVEMLVFRSAEKERLADKRERQLEKAERAREKEEAGHANGDERVTSI